MKLSNIKTSGTSVTKWIACVSRMLESYENFNVNDVTLISDELRDTGILTISPG
jgi:hypothetical protein